MNTWPDCNPGDWFSLAVQEATNSHVVPVQDWKL